MLEENIIQQCQAGELDRFADLYDAYFAKVYRFVYYKTQHKETAEDLVSNIFIKALKSINRFDSCKGTFQAWLFQIARNSVIDHYRAKKNLVNIDDVWSLGQGSGVIEELDNKERFKKIKPYLDKLSIQQREIIILRIWQEMSFKEISQIMRQSEASSKMAFYRGIKKIKSNAGILTAILLLTINL